MIHNATQQLTCADNKRFNHLPHPIPLRYPESEVSLRLRGGRDTGAEVVPAGAPDVWRGCGLWGPDGASTGLPKGGTSPGFG